MEDRIAAGALWTAAAAWGREAANLAITLLLARRLGPEAYGAVGMASIVVTLGQSLLARAIREVLIQRKDLDRRALDTAFWLVCALGLAASAVTVASAPGLARFFDQPAIADLALALSPLPILTSLSSFQIALLMRDLKFAALALRSLCGVIAGGAVGLAMAYAGYGALSLVGLLLAQAVIEVAILSASSRWRPGFHVAMAPARELGRAALWLMGNGVVAYADQQLMRGFVGYMFGPVVLGFYVLSWRMIEVVISLLVTPISNAALVAFARAQDEPEKLREIFLSTTALVALLALPAFTGCLVLAPAGVPLLFGPQWDAGVAIFQILCGFAMIDAVWHAYDALLVGTGRARRLFTINGACLPILAVLLLAVGGWDPTATAFVLLARDAVILPLYFRAASDLVGPVHHIEFGRYARFALATAAMGTTVMWWLPLGARTLPLPAALASSVLLGVAVYLVCSFLIARATLIEAYRTLRQGGAAMGRFA